MRMNLLMILIARIEFCEKNVLYTGHRMRIYYSIFCLLAYYSFFVFLSQETTVSRQDRNCSFFQGKPECLLGSVCVNDKENLLLIIYGLPIFLITYRLKPSVLLVWGLHSTAICENQLSGEAPCQCSMFGAISTTSPGSKRRALLPRS